MNSAPNAFCLAVGLVVSVSELSHAKSLKVRLQAGKKMLSECSHPGSLSLSFYDSAGDSLPASLCEGMWWLCVTS